MLRSRRRSRPYRVCPVDGARVGHGRGILDAAGPQARVAGAGAATWAHRRRRRPFRDIGVLGAVLGLVLPRRHTVMWGGLAGS